MSENEVLHAWVKIQTADGASYAFSIDPSTYVKRDIVDFAPRSGGGDVAYSNLDLYQIVTQDSWHHGIGFIQFRDKFGYRVTSDSVDTRHVGMALMFPKYSTAYTAPSGGMINCVDFNGNTYLNLGSGGIWKRTLAGAFSQVYAGSVGDILTNGAYLVAALPTGRMQTSQTGSSWSSAGVSGNPPNNFGQLEIHNGFLWGSESNASGTKTLSGTSDTAGNVNATGISFILYGTGTSFATDLSNGDIIVVDPSGDAVRLLVTSVDSATKLYVQSLSTGIINLGDTISKSTPGLAYDCVHFWSSGDSSDAEGGGIADIGAIVTGSGSQNIKAIASFNNVLYVARLDGVWAVDDTVTPPIARRVLSFSDEQHSSNFSIFLTWRGRLYFNIKNVLYAYNGSSLANVTPPTFSLDYPPLSFGGFISATYRGAFLYVLAATNEATPVYHLLAFDGTGWFQLLNLGTTVPTGIGYSPLADMLFIGMTGGAIRSVPFQSKSELPYPGFDSNVVSTVSNETISLLVQTDEARLSLSVIPVVAGSVALQMSDGITLYNIVDNGAGQLYTNGVYCGTIDYITGACVVIISGTNGTAVADYQSISTGVVGEEHVLTGVSPFYHCTLDNVPIIAGSLGGTVFGGDPIQESIPIHDNAGSLFDPGEGQFLGTINYETGQIDWNLDNMQSPVYIDYRYDAPSTISGENPSVSLIGTLYSSALAHGNVEPSTLSISITAGSAYTVTDDGDGLLNDQNGTPRGTVNYITGALSLIFTNVTGTTRASYYYTSAFSGHHYLNLSEIDFGFRRVIKSFAEIDVEVYNVALGRYVAVDYSADSGAWSRLGFVTANGVTKFNMIPTVEANKLDVRLDFQTSDSAQSVILRNFTAKAMIRPDTLYGHQFMVVGGNEIKMLDGTYNKGSSEEQKQWLEAVRSSKAPITFIDPFGVSHLGYMSTTSFRDIQRRQGENQSNWACVVNLVEVR